MILKITLVFLKKKRLILVIRLTGHEKEGYGLSWNDLKRGYVASGSDDCKVLVWDINNTNCYNDVESIYINSTCMKSLINISNAHTDVVEERKLQ